MMIIMANNSEAAPKLRSWEEAQGLATKLVGQMSLEQKVNITTGMGFNITPCVGNTYPITNPDFPSLCLQDAPLGMRFAYNVTLGVAGINAAASFDRKAMLERGVYMGQEYYGKGVHVQLGPAMNFMRSPEGGRGWESFGEDPYLSGVASYETISGVQSQGVISTAKHFVANDQEKNRHEESSNVDDRTMHEIYLWPFARAVEAGVGSVMCSYNKVNGTSSCENDMMNRILRDQLGFQGFIQTDWWAAMETVQSANNGLDMVMPGNMNATDNYSPSYYGQNLVNAVKNGEVKESTVTDMAHRIVSAWYKVGQDENFPKTSLNSFHPTAKGSVNVEADHKVKAREMGAASVVLLTNKNKILPLTKADNSISIIGSDAFSDPLLFDSKKCSDFGCDPATLVQGWGSGSVTFPSYIVPPVDGIQARAGKNVKFQTTRDNWNLDEAKKVAQASDIAIVFANSDSGEEYITVDGNAGDRNNLTLWNNGDNLIQTVADANKNTIVVIHSVGPILMPWINHPNIKAVVWPGLPGQESGNSLADVLYGDVNPSGRLPYTIAKNQKDYAAAATSDLEIDYSEKLNIGYRWFDAKDIEPLFPFGHGLSYTKFDYGSLKVKSDNKKNQVNAQLVIQNTGKADGAEIVQLYLSFPESAGEPPKVLRGFEKVFVKSGQKQTVSFELSKTELSIWDVASQSWVIPHGQFQIHVGASSRDLRQTSSFTL
ncbi:glycoside hydrolase superfamily [Halteromyces radiatus]|uniref:glycoside hydrolase superfamily n=1 Tax=Halteromyces radiatus TaxID=101107 RepID=UPI00221FCBBE|nr:glycoside hydrolase superfamily [Halteromyces radiatus]KAI8080067.1 glycoside hydrolase superfamily [Halteromyces radiatus]